MILNFSVKNFRSVMEETIISFTATADKTLSKYLIPTGKKNVLPIVALYGDVASGKSNIIAALIRMRDMICGKYSCLQPGEKLPFEPFAFTCDKNEYTAFEAEYIYKGIRYKYSFSYNETEILSEKLNYWPNGREALVFSRNGLEYIFRENVSEQHSIAERTLRNRLYLRSSNDWNYAGTYDAIQWFISGIISLNSENDICFLSYLQDKEFRKMFIHELRNADPSVCDLKETENKYDIVYRINDSIKTVVPVEMQSSGFIRYYNLLAVCMTAFRTGSLVLADNYDNNISERLTRRITELVISPETNPEHAQLLCAVHDTSLMDQSLLRRDEIYLTEKLYSCSGTVVHPVTYFSPRKDKRIDYGYRNNEFKIEMQPYLNNPVK